MMEIAAVAIDGGSFAVLCLVLYVLFELKKDVSDHDKRQRDVQSAVDNIAGRIEAIERVTFPAMVREIQETKQ